MSIRRLFVLVLCAVGLSGVGCGTRRATELEIARMWCPFTDTEFNLVWRTIGVVKESGATRADQYEDAFRICQTDYEGYRWDLWSSSEQCAQCFTAIIEAVY